MFRFLRNVFESFSVTGFMVSYGIAKCLREITRGSVMCRYLTTNELIYDRMNTLYNTMIQLFDLAMIIIACLIIVS